jgi:hypothetical protein
MRGQLEETCGNSEDPSRGPLLSMEFTSLERYRMLFWNGSLENPRLVLHTANPTLEPFHFHRYPYKTSISACHNNILDHGW